ncbi:MAG: hypothetical protein M0C28_23235 [Candidatus Moduliflexus flocculans]|nr:hypothetical protein [Candidatus Moduliflexus flocculans]
MTRVVKVVGPGEWITGGLWGAYEQWALGAREERLRRRRAAGCPTGGTIDALTPDNPCLLSSFDGELFLANTAALRAAGLEQRNASRAWTVDDAGRATGLVAARVTRRTGRMRAAVKPKSVERLLRENRAALPRSGRGRASSRSTTSPTPRRPSAFVAAAAGAARSTSRVWMRPDLSRGAELRDRGLHDGPAPRDASSATAYLRYGALKGYIDGIMGTHGALFFEPYADQPGNYGHYRPHTSDDPKHARAEHGEDVRADQGRATPPGSCRTSTPSATRARR